MLEGNVSWICLQNFKSTSRKMAETWHKTCKKQALFTSFRDFTVIFRILFSDRFWCFKKGFRIIFSRSLRKSDLKTCIAALYPDFFYLFYLVTWDDLDLYYGHKAQEMIPTDVSDTIHAVSLALFALKIEILLADVAKPENSKILILTSPVTSSVSSGSNFLLVRVVHVQHYRMAFEIWKSVQ